MVKRFERESSKEILAKPNLIGKAAKKRFKMNELEAARIVLSYYEVIDSNPTSEDHWLRSDHALRSVLEKFSNYNPDQNNIVITLFLVRNSLQETINALDLIGSDSPAEMAENAFKQTDANLRAIVSMLTEQHVHLPYEPEADFVKNFDPKIRNVFWLDFDKH